MGLLGISGFNDVPYTGVSESDAWLTFLTKLNTNRVQSERLLYLYSVTWVRCASGHFLVNLCWIIVVIGTLEMLIRLHNKRRWEEWVSHVLNRAIYWEVFRCADVKKHKIRNPGILTKFKCLIQQDLVLHLKRKFIATNLYASQMTCSW